MALSPIAMPSEIDGVGVGVGVEVGVGVAVGSGVEVGVGDGVGVGVAVGGDGVAVGVGVKVGVSVGVAVAVGVGGSGPAVGVPPPEQAATNAINTTMAGPNSESRPIFIRTQPFYPQTFKQPKSHQVYNDDWELWQ